MGEIAPPATRTPHPLGAIVFAKGKPRTNELRVSASRSRGENSVGLNVAGMIATLRPMDFSDRTWCVGR